MTNTMLPRTRALLFIATLSLSALRAAAAEGTPRRATPGAPAPKASTQSAESDVGLVIVVASLVVGAAVTAYGLSVNCGARDHACHRQASLPLWGGLGIAAAGTLVGLSLIEGARGGVPSTAISVGGRFD